MIKRKQGLLFLLVLFVVNSYAITVNVKSPSANVSGIGFGFKDKRYGGRGTSYQKSNMPNGAYTFGVRVNGLFGDDVQCATANGKKTLLLNKDTTAILNYDGKKCVIKIAN